MPGTLEFEVGSVYRRSQVHEALGGQRQGGICTPRDHPVVILFNNPEGTVYGYRDEWKEDGFFHYTGEGQKGPMQMKRGNSAIRDHVKDKKRLMLFREQKKGLHEFAGYMEYAGHYIEEIPSRFESQRQGFIFKLRPVAGPPPEEQVAGPNGISLTDLRERALWASNQTVGRTTHLSAHRERSRAVADYVLARAGGFCEGCGLPAPFARKDGTTPYLETHHIHRLSDEGPDAPSEVIALCPTCHRRVHYGGGGETYNRLELAKSVAAYEESYARDRLKIVTAAIIFGSRGRVLVCQRAKGALAGYWEFPGGKVRGNEKPEDCIRREIEEELHLTLDTVVPFIKVDHDCPEFHIRLLCFACQAKGTPAFIEHRAGRWAGPEQLVHMNLAPADAVVARRLLSGRGITDLPLVADRGNTQYPS